MITTGSIFLALLLLLVILLQVRAYYILKRQHKIITEQSVEIHKQNVAFARQNQQLSELNIEKQQIIGVVSHDLKGPFNRIFALIQLMNMSNDNLTDDQKEYLGKIHQIAVDGLNMVRNLLDSKKLEDHQLEMTLDTLSLEPFLISFVKNYRTVAEKKRIEILLHCPSDVNVYVDRLFLSRILDNLLSNAIKFSKPDKTVVVSVEDKKEEVLLHIKDEGPGISEEDQKKLYQKFQRLTARPTAGESSTGLGLSIVKTLVLKMGGNVYCDSVLDQGSTFTVSLKKP
ncbi:MAG TPA: HAMP domain-containing sensor histidine kinase [Cyclobacteriaceae bacterium]|nr:HAMP domain-containing sensor histidine kinase [Cyclobacteriaceae bacterium]